MERDELGSWLRLSLTPGVGNETARKLLAAFGLPDAVWRQSASAIRQVAQPSQVLSLRTEPNELPALLDLTWHWLQASGGGAARRQILVLGDPDYPPSLLTIDDPPLMLYLLGAGSLASNTLVNSIAVVGSRNPSPQGATNSQQFSKALALAGLTIVSGMALGIDGAAHEGALASVEPGSVRLATIALVGTGLDRVYPKRHLELAHRIAHNGLLVSEYPLGTPPLTANFPRRNRLIAGLAQATLVVEAALQSGSLITARLTAEQGKDVFAIPGSIHSPQSRGCHALIKQGAKLVESAQDVLEEMKIVSRSSVSMTSRVATTGHGDPDKAFGPANCVLEALGFDPVGLDALQARTDLGTADLQAQLMALELDARVARLPGGLFQRI